MLPSFAHQNLIDRIASLDEIPRDTIEYDAWIEAGGHLSLLRENADEDELIIYASGDYTFIHTAVVSNDKLSTIDKNDLLGWSCNPFTAAASYTSGDGHESTWIVRDMRTSGSKTLEGARQLVFARTFEGWPDDDGTYIEILQEYVHLTGIHWRPEQHSYCQFDELGDMNHVVSTTMKKKKKNVALVSFRREPLEHYLAASDSTLVRMFEFLLLRRKSLTGWPEGDEVVVNERDNLFYRQKVAVSMGSYTRGVQIVRPSRAQPESFSTMAGEWLGQRNNEYVEFIAHDWRNKRVTKISTNPTATTNYFEAEGNSLPYEVSPAFFRPEVILKYKGDRDKYTISERNIQCRAAWMLQNYDVNEAGQVHTYICYLRNLPHTEQLHWLSYNEPPKAGISKRAHITDFEGKFPAHTTPLQDILSIARSWDEKKVSWWNLPEETLLSRLSQPITASRDEWAEAFMDLSKLIIEGFNVKGIRAKLTELNLTFKKEDKSLKLIERLLTGHSKVADMQRLEGLRTVQLIRTKVKGHSGGSEAAKLTQDAQKQHETFSAHFDYVCAIIAAELTRIERSFS